MSEGNESLFSARDQVKIEGKAHPWHGAIGRIIGPWKSLGGEWEIELETEHPGHRCTAYGRELRHV